MAQFILCGKNKKDLNYNIYTYITKRTGAQCTCLTQSASGATTLSPLVDHPTDFNV